MAKRLKKFRDSDWNEHKTEERQRQKEKKSSRSEDRKQKLSDKRQFLS